MQLQDKFDELAFCFFVFLLRGTSWTLKLVMVDDDAMAAGQTCQKTFVFFIQLLVVIAKFNETDRLNASRDQHSYFIEGLRPKLLEDGQDLKGLRWCHAFDRRLRRHLGFGVANAFAFDYAGRSIASFTFGIIMLAGDVCPNSGPRNVKDPFGICS